MVLQLGARLSRRISRFKNLSLSLSLSQASFEQLSLVEFRELLRLVNTCPLEKLDPRLTALRRQTKKWFRRLMALVQLQLHS